MKFLFLLPLFALGCAAPRIPTCFTQGRAVIDLGSGTTKLNMGKVEICEDRTRLLEKVGNEVQRPLALEAAKTEQGEIPPLAQKQILSTLTDLRDEARRQATQAGLKNLEITIVATHALRTATNRDEILKTLNEARLPARVISQEQEAIAGFTAAKDLAQGCAPEKVMVWDIGGGSAQLVQAQSLAPQITAVALGAESFRQKTDALFKKDQKNCGGMIGTRGFVRARGLARQALAIKAKPDACVIGIGSLHAKAVQAQILKNWRHVAACACGQQPNCLPTPEGYSKKEVTCLATYLANKNECAPEIAGPYARTAVSNLALVLGFMDQLGVERVQVRPINMGDYYLVETRGTRFIGVDLTP